MKLTHHLNALLWAAKLRHDPPQALAADSVEGFSSINKSCVQVTVLLLTLLLKLASCEDHVDSSTTFSEATLCLWQQALFEVRDQTIQQDSRKDFPSYRQERNPAAVVACLAIALPLVEVYSRLFIADILRTLSSANVACSPSVSRKG